MPCDSNPPLPSSPLLPAIQPLSVLYADDVQQLRELLAVILKREGHQCETVENGADALASLEEAREQLPNNPTIAKWIERLRK